MSKGVSGRVGWEEISSGESLEGGIYGSSNRGNPKIQDFFSKLGSSPNTKKCILLTASMSEFGNVGLDFEGSQRREVRNIIFYLRKSASIHPRTSLSNIGVIYSVIHLPP